MAEHSDLTVADVPLARRAIAGAVGGFVAGIGMGLVMQFGIDIMPILGNLLGEPTAVRGWIAHLFTSVLFGLMFAALLSIPLVHDLSETLYGCILLGVFHASGLAIVMIGIGFPLVTNVLGAPSATAGGVPGPGLLGFVETLVFAGAHLVYGVILGAVYPLIRGY